MGKVKCFENIPSSFPASHLDKMLNVRSKGQELKKVKLQEMTWSLKVSP